MYVVLCFVSSPLLFFADLFADLLTWIPISSIWKLLIPLIPIFVGIWYLKTTTSKPKPKPAKQKPVEKKETSSSCSNCGNTLNPKAKFCGGCGNVI
jgi:cadmium resistance protein CadD (predicted permease)